MSVVHASHGAVHGVYGGAHGLSGAVRVIINNGMASCTFVLPRQGVFWGDLPQTPASHRNVEATICPGMSWFEL